MLTNVSWLRAYEKPKSHSLRKESCWVQLTGPGTSGTTAPRSDLVKAPRQSLPVAAAAAETPLTSLWASPTTPTPGEGLLQNRMKMFLDQSDFILALYPLHSPGLLAKVADSS